MRTRIRIGSRESLLAVRQAEIIRDRIRQADPEIETEIVTMKTTGDKILDKSLAKIGGKGLFVKELDRALLEGKIDISVHSLKDMPMELNPDIPILAYGKREDPRDVILFREGIAELKAGSVVGTSSRRRKLQLKELYPGCIFKGIRGNVQTRMRKLSEEGYDATLLAAAGLARLGMESCAGRYLSVEEMIPAAGQGILAVQGRKDADYPWLSLIDDRKARLEAIAERCFIRAAGGGCTSPSAAHAQLCGEEMKLFGLYYSEEKCTYQKDVICVRIDGEDLRSRERQAERAGEGLALRLMGSL